MLKEILKTEIKTLIKECDEDPERDFLGELGAIRKHVVYDTKQITVDEFDDICREILKEIE